MVVIGLFTTYCVGTFRDFRIGNWELGIGNWELGIGNWELEKFRIFVGAGLEISYRILR
ncbi:MAG: hypothetical protein F6K47_41270 [Symploca sp. SIO2E6]|nr:hypothetical protein [Symploca sp. SIO2E6]